MVPDNRRGNSLVSLAIPGSVVECKVDARYGAIHVGDLLTTSPTVGHAMKTGDPQLGTIIGKAIESHDLGIGTIKIITMF